MPVNKVVHRSGSSQAQGDGATSTAVAASHDGDATAQVKQFGCWHCFFLPT
jgi:hypothetical protein